MFYIKLNSMNQIPVIYEACDEEGSNWIDVEFFDTEDEAHRWIASVADDPWVYYPSIADEELYNQHFGQRSK